MKVTRVLPYFGSILAVLLLFTGCVPTQTGLNPVTSLSPSGRLPVNDLPIEWQFPDRFLVIPRVSYTNYENTTPGLGYSIGYSQAGVSLTAYVYDLGIPSIPDGIGSNTIYQSFQGAATDIRVASKQGHYQLVTMQRGEEEYLGDHPVLFTQAEIVVHDRPKMTYLMVTGLDNKILKIRITIDEELYGESDYLLQDLKSEIYRELIVPNRKESISNQNLLSQS